MSIRGGVGGLVVCEASFVLGRTLPRVYQVSTAVVKLLKVIGRWATNSSLFGIIKLSSNQLV